MEAVAKDVERFCIFEDELPRSGGCWPEYTPEPESGSGGIQVVPGWSTGNDAHAMKKCWQK